MGRPSADINKIDTMLKSKFTYERIRQETGCSLNTISKRKKILFPNNIKPIHRPMNKPYLTIRNRKIVRISPPSLNRDNIESIIRCFQLHGDPRIKSKVKNYLRSI